MLKNKITNVREGRVFHLINDPDVIYAILMDYEETTQREREKLIFILARELYDSVLGWIDPFTDELYDFTEHFGELIYTLDYDNIDFEKLLHYVNLGDSDKKDYGITLVNSLKYLIAKDYKQFEINIIYDIIKKKRKELINPAKLHIEKILRVLIAYESGICKDLEKNNFELFDFEEGYYLRLHELCVWTSVYNTSDYYPLLCFSFDDIYTNAENHVRKRFKKYNIKIPKERFYTIDDIMVMHYSEVKYINRIILKYQSGEIKPAEKIKDR